MRFSITGKKMIPNSARNGNNDPIQGAEEKALDRVPVFVNTKAAAFTRTTDTEKNKDAQRQPAAISGQVGSNAVAESFAEGPLSATEEYKQAGKVDR